MMKLSYSKASRELRKLGFTGVRLAKKSMDGIQFLAHDRYKRQVVVTVERNPIVGDPMDDSVLTHTQHKVWAKYGTTNEYVGEVDIPFQEGQQPLCYALAIDGFKLSESAKKKLGLSDFDMVASIKEWHSEECAVGENITYGDLLLNEEMLEDVK